MPTSRLHRILAPLVATSMLAGCNDYPVHSLLDSFEARVTSRLAHDKPIKLDFLWVIDHSASMCSHQVDLARGFKDFVGQLQSAGQIDAQMAVVSVQQVPDKPTDTSGYIQKVGQFLHRAETKFPPNCIEKFKMPCTSDGQCASKTSFTFKPDKICSQSTLCTNWSGTEEQGLTQTFKNTLPAATSNCPPEDPSCNWRCRVSGAASALINDNCSINSNCWRHCTTAKECHDTFEPNNPNPRMICYHPGGSPSKDSGCQYPPPTEDCPAAKDIPPVLGTKKRVIAGKEWNELDLFHCSATVGAAQTQESKFEGGLRSAWMALDPNGPNCPKDANGVRTAACQNKQLLRDDAYLVIVVVSDDDDCSVNLQIPLENATAAQKAALDAILTLEVRERCQEYGDAVGGNQWLNEGNCEYLKGLSGQTITFCPCDCRAMAKGSPERAKCENTVANDRAKFAKVDFRFASVNEFVNKFRSLKSDPAKVIFAAVTGFSLAKDADKSYSDGVAFYKSQLKNIAPGSTPYVCAGAKGDAGFGTRYVQTANAFKDNGVVLNICEGDNFGAQLSKIANKILLRVVKQCLPAPPDTDKDGKPIMQVLLKRPDATGKVKSIPLHYVEDCSKGKDLDYCVQETTGCSQTAGTASGQDKCNGASDCSGGLQCIEGLCRVYSRAIFFPWVLQPKDEVEVNYGADLGIL